MLDDGLGEEGKNGGCCTRLCVLLDYSSLAILPFWSRVIISWEVTTGRWSGLPATDDMLGVQKHVLGKGRGGGVLSMGN